MPYKVEIADTEESNTFLKNLPKDILAKLSEHLQLLGEHPYLGRSIEAPIPACLYSFQIMHAEQNHKFIVSYKIDEGNETIYITSFGRTIIKT
jgi:mRNA-degrading endonuclease RelE of RelBE toxin-antitoxin system